MKGHLVAFDIGGTKIAVLARDMVSGRLVYADKLKTPADEGLGAILALLDAEIDAVPGGRERMTALGVAVPGHVDADGHVLNAGNLKGWVNIPLRELLEDRYGVPVFVERDANCGALGEKYAGAARKMDDFVFLSLGTGVGAGIVIDGRIYRGAHFGAGEAGDITVPAGHDANEKTRTVSDVVGKKSIKQKVKRATGKKMTAAEALAESEPRVEDATRDAVDYLSTCVVAISSLLDPEAILFGGGTSKAGETLLRRVRARIAPHLVLRPRLMLAGLGTDSQLHGALWGASRLVSRARVRKRRGPQRIVSSKARQSA
jgi:glucokinase